MNQPHDPRDPGPWPQQPSAHPGEWQAQAQQQQGPWPQQQQQPGPWPQQQQQPGPWPQQQQPGPWPQQQQQPGPWPQQQQQPGPWTQQQGPQAPGGPWPSAPAQPYPGAPWPGQGPGSAPQAPPHHPPHSPWPTPYVPGHPWGAGVVPRQQHEFTAEENQVLADLALWSGALGILKLVQAATGILGKNILGALIELAVGISLLGGRKALRSAVDTEGNDIDHLMIAVEKLATVFQFRLILSLVGAVLVLLAVGLVMLLAALGHPIDLGS